MAYKRKTLRQMSPVAKKLGRLIGEVDSIRRRLKTLIPEIQSLEADSKALRNHQCRVTPALEETADIFPPEDALVVGSDPRD